MACVSSATSSSSSHMFRVIFLSLFQQRKGIKRRAVHLWLSNTLPRSAVLSIQGYLLVHLEGGEVRGAEGKEEEKGIPLNFHES